MGRRRRGRAQRTLRAVKTYVKTYRMAADPTVWAVTKPPDEDTVRHMQTGPCWFPCNMFSLHNKLAKGCQVQESYGMCPGSHSQGVTEVGFNPRPP